MVSEMAVYVSSCLVAFFNVLRLLDLADALGPGRVAQLVVRLTEEPEVQVSIPCLAHTFL